MSWLELQSEVFREHNNLDSLPAIVLQVKHGVYFERLSIIVLQLEVLAQRQQSVDRRLTGRLTCIGNVARELTGLRQIAVIRRRARAITHDTFKVVGLGEQRQIADAANAVVVKRQIDCRNSNSAELERANHAVLTTGSECGNMARKSANGANQFPSQQYDPPYGARLVVEVALAVLGYSS